MLSRRFKLLISSTLVLALVPALDGLVSTCPAATIVYADLGPVPPGISFTDIMESSITDPVPLYGQPDAFSIGLDFDPTSFAASANGGTSDITDGQLNFTVMGIGINSISMFESGDYTLAGVGTAATQAIAGAIMQATVTQINGINVAPINLIPVNGSVAFNLVANPGVVQPWSLGLMIDVAGQLGANQHATKVEVVIDNQLLAFSETGSVAFIAKKDFRVDVEVIPEPASRLLLLCGYLAWGSMARRRTI